MIATRETSAAGLPSRFFRGMAAAVVLTWLAGVVIVFIAPGIDHLSARMPAWNDSAGLTRVMKDFSFIGKDIVIGLAFLALALWSWWKLKGDSWVATFVVTGLGALVLDNIIKPLVARPRPEFEQLVGGKGYSWPSGHAIAAAALCVALAMFASERTNKKALVWGLAIGVAVAVAGSRVYLGVHYPTDVIAGLVLGGSWAVYARAVTRSVRTPVALPAPARAAPAGDRVAA